MIDKNDSSSESSNMIKQAASGVYFLQSLIVNIFFIAAGDNGLNRWFLIDTGLSNSKDKIMEGAAKLWGENSRPEAIILTHGHFDHVGSVKELSSIWDVDVYAHELELPYLTGLQNYPPPDPTVGGGLMAQLSPFYPNEGINLSSRVRSLPSDGSLPNMPGWRWVHTPGHTKGHISLFRDIDRVLIAGDAITTVKQESASAVITQKQELHGPPAYFTPEWQTAWNSVKLLASLKPSLIISSHGQPMEGEEMSKQLNELTENFDRMAIPPHGKYVP